MDPEFLKDRLAEVDSQHTDLLELLDPAREKWLDEKDPKVRDDLKAVYNDIMSMIDVTGNRLMQLEAGLKTNGECASTGPLYSFTSKMCAAASRFAQPFSGSLRLPCSPI